MEESGKNQARVEVPYFDGINSLVSHTLAQANELYHAENFRSTTIGTIETRDGATVVGTDVNGNPFITTANYGLFNFPNPDPSNNGLFRISATAINAFSVSVSDYQQVTDSTNGDPSKLIPITIFVGDTETITENINNINGGQISSIYALNSYGQWVGLPNTAYGTTTNIVGGQCDTTLANGNVYMVNQVDDNRYIENPNGYVHYIETAPSTFYFPLANPGQGNIVITANNAGFTYNDMFGCPPSSKINYYKNRLYVADYIYQGVRYPTSILRSSYPLGIVALVNQDVTAETVGTPVPGWISLGTAWVIPVTDSKYFWGVYPLGGGQFSSLGPNDFTVWRGNIKVADISIGFVSDYNVVISGVTFYKDSGGTTFNSFLAGDEVWVYGTKQGPKSFRWPANSTSVSNGSTLYDSFQLASGDSSPINLLSNIGNVMLIANTNTMMAWNDYILENFDMGVGCVSKNGSVKSLGSLFFIHYNGIYKTTGEMPQLASLKVDRYIKGATKQGLESSCAGKKGRSVIFTLGDVTLYRLDGSIDKVIKDCALEYNITQDQWFVHSNVTAKEFATFIDTLNPDRLMQLDTTGNLPVKEFLDSTNQTDNGSPIFFRADTQLLSLGGPSAYEYYSTPIAITIETERGNQGQMFASMDNEEYFPIEGSIEKGISILKVNNENDQRGKPRQIKQMSLSIRGSTPQKIKINRLSIIYTKSTTVDAAH